MLRKARNEVEDHYRQHGAFPDRINLHAPHVQFHFVPRTGSSYQIIATPALTDELSLALTREGYWSKGGADPHPQEKLP